MHGQLPAALGSGVPTLIALIRFCMPPTPPHFPNPHPTLIQVHQKTGESAEQIAERKRQAAWGAWLDVPFNPAVEEEEEEEKEAEPAAAAALLQPRRLSGGNAAACAALPEGAGGALLLYAALRWHQLASRFCAAVQVGLLRCWDS